MGHSSIQVTVDLYGHLIPGGNKQAVARLDTPVDNVVSEAEFATSAQPLSAVTTPVASEQLSNSRVTKEGLGVSDEVVNRIEELALVRGLNQVAVDVIQLPP
jgi:integrase